MNSFEVRLLRKHFVHFNITGVSCEHLSRIILQKVLLITNCIQLNVSSVWKKEYFLTQLLRLQILLDCMFYLLNVFVFTFKKVVNQPSEQHLIDEMALGLRGSLEN